MQKFSFERWHGQTILVALCIASGVYAQQSMAGPSDPTDVEIKVGQSTIHLKLSPDLPVRVDAAKEWTDRAATAVSDYYGKFPVSRVTIQVGTAASAGVQDGVEFSGDRISIKIGKNTEAGDLTNDWMMTHEMFHLSQPSLDDDYSWMSEGMADYLEPVARVRIGQITKEQFWKDLVEGLPQGLPENGDKGLDHTHTWARTYWGGSLFWLLADTQIRQQTNNAKSVRDAALKVLDDGGDGSQDWTIDRLIAEYGAGTGTTVFKTLHDEMGSKPVNTDLKALWKSLGINYSEQTHSVTFNDFAPLAKIRQKITEK